MKSIGEVMRSVRQLLNKPQKQMASDLSVTDVHLCNVEKGASQPSLVLIGRFRKLTGIDPYVLAWADSQNRKTEVGNAAVNLADLLWDAANRSRNEAVKS